MFDCLLLARSTIVEAVDEIFYQIFRQAMNCLPFVSKLLAPCFQKSVGTSLDVELDVATTLKEGPEVG